MLEFKEYIDEEKGEFKLLTPPDWNKDKKSRTVKAMLAEDIIKQANDSLTRPVYSLATTCENNNTTTCENNEGIVADAELIKENAELKKMVDDLRRKADDLQRKADGLQRAFDAEHKGYLKWRDKYNDLKEEKDRLEILLNR